MGAARREPDFFLGRMLARAEIAGWNRPGLLGTDPAAGGEHGIGGYRLPSRTEVGGIAASMPSNTR